jgi:hypothetical protein
MFGRGWNSPALEIWLLAGLVVGVAEQSRAEAEAVREKDKQQRERERDREAERET